MDPKLHFAILNARNDRDHQRVLDLIQQVGDELSLDMWFTKGDAHAGLCQYQEAINAYNVYIQNKPNAMWPIFDSRGRAYLGLNKISEAFSDFQTVYRLDPNIGGLWYHIGDFYFNQYINNNPDIVDPLIKCRAAYEKGIKWAPEYGEETVYLPSEGTISKLSLVKDGENFSHLTGNDILNPFKKVGYSGETQAMYDSTQIDSIVLDQKIESLQKQGKYTEAIKLIKQAQSKGIPLKENTYFLKGVCELQLGDEENASKTYSEFFDKYPRAWKEFDRISYLLFNINKIADAFIWFKRSLDINPSNAELWLMIGNYYLESMFNVDPGTIAREEYEQKCISAFRRVAELDPVLLGMDIEYPYGSEKLEQLLKRNRDIPNIPEERILKPLEL